MTCNCVKEDVCVHKRRISEAVEGILEIRFGGPRVGSSKLWDIIRQVCKHRPKAKPDAVWVDKEAL